MDHSVLLDLMILRLNNKVDELTKTFKLNTMFILQQRQYRNSALLWKFNIMFFILKDWEENSREKNTRKVLNPAT